MAAAVVVGDDCCLTGDWNQKRLQVRYSNSTSIRWQRSVTRASCQRYNLCPKLNLGRRHKYRLDPN